jgi:hypothetical protein
VRILKGTWDHAQRQDECDDEFAFTIIQAEKKAKNVRCRMATS